MTMIRRLVGLVLVFGGVGVVAIGVIWAWLVTAGANGTTATARSAFPATRGIDPSRGGLASAFAGV